MSLAASVGVCLSVCMSVSEKRIFARHNHSAAKVNIVKRVRVQRFQVDSLAKNGSYGERAGHVCPRAAAAAATSFAFAHVVPAASAAKHHCFCSVEQKQSHRR